MPDTEPAHVPAARTATIPPPSDEPSDAVRTWLGEGFRVELRHSPAPLDGTATWLSYRVFDERWARLSGQDPLIFAGDDLGTISPADAGYVIVHALSAILGCESGDMPDTYFQTYSPTQLAWRDARAADLLTWGSTLAGTR